MNLCSPRHTFLVALLQLPTSSETGSRPSRPSSSKSRTSTPLESESFRREDEVRQFCVLTLAPSPSVAATQRASKRSSLSSLALSLSLSLVEMTMKVNSKEYVLDAEF